MRTRRAWRSEFDVASIIIQRSWPDGDELAVSIEVDDSYPDVVAEAKRAAVDTYREALGLSLAGNDSDS